MKEDKKKSSLLKNVTSGTALAVLVIGVGYVSYHLGSKIGFDKAVNTVVTKFPYMGFIKHGFNSIL